MTDHQILNFADHQSLRIHTEAGAELGDGEMAYLAVPAEFRVLACEFPVVFRYNAANENFSALALLGFESGENLFLQDGNWDASCKPLAMSIQPFLVGMTVVSMKNEEEGKRVWPIRRIMPGKRSYKFCNHNGCTSTSQRGGVCFQRAGTRDTRTKHK
jgi:hypothetical protein